jgi:hypothetical protein
MSAPVKQDAAFRWTENGQSYLHYLGAKIRRPTVNPVQQVHRWRSADLTTERVISIGSGVQDLSGTLRFDGSPDSLARFVAAGRRGASLEYFPSLAAPSLSFPCVLVEAGEITTDPDLWFDRRHQVDVRLRRIDGGSWQALLEAPLFYWKAGNLLPGMVFTRSGTVGPYVGENGLLQNEATPNVFRTDWLHGEPATLLEGEGQNEFTRSEELDHSDWAKAAASVTANQAVGPDGVASLDEIIEDGTNASHLVQQGATLTADVDCAWSGFFRANTRAWVLLQMQESGAGGNNVRGWFNLDTGAVGNTDANGTGAFTRAYVEDYGGGLYRCVLVGSVGNSATSILANARLATGDSISLYQGDGSSSIYGGYMQMEDDAPVASSYIKTTAAAASRGVENLTADFDHAPQPMTGYHKIGEIGAAFDPDLRGFFDIGLASSARLIVRKDQSGNRYEVSLQSGGSSIAQSEMSAAVSFADTVEVVWQLTATTLQIFWSINGGAIGSGGVANFADLPAAWASDSVKLITSAAPVPARHLAHKVFRSTIAFAEMRAA